jgi:hypothetical protein
MTATHERAAAPTKETAAHIFKNSPQDTDSIGRFNRKNGELPPFLKDMLSTAPQSGGGFHTWMFSVSRHLHAHRNEGEIFALLSVAAAGCGRHVPDREIIAAIKDAWPCRYQLSQSMTPASKPAPKWPARDEKRIAEIAAADPNALDKLRDSSPVQVSPQLHDSECLLERLFPGNPLLCVGHSAHEFFTAPRESFKGRLAGFQFITPSPMSALVGMTKDGKPSAHCLDNTGERFYLVVECDQGDRNTQAAIIRQLATVAPLAMVVDSAGKSLHSWFHCRGQSEDKLRMFFRMAVALGGDPPTWTRSQFVRMPLAIRDNGKLQAVHFFNYSATETTKGGTKP